MSTFVEFSVHRFAEFGVHRFAGWNGMFCRLHSVSPCIGMHIFAHQLRDDKKDIIFSRRKLLINSCWKYLN